MTLLFTVLAAVISTVVWYLSEKARVIKVGILCYLFWGASLMWLVDAAAEYKELGKAYFLPEQAQLVNDAFLGLSVIVLGLVIWVVTVLVKDPLKVMKR